jgi:cell wall-associated NlpC family hydrolase
VTTVLRTRRLHPDQGTATLGLLVIPFLLLALILMTVAALGAAHSSAASCASAVGQQVNGQRLDSEQIASALTIVQVAANLHLPVAAAQIAVATAMQESSLRNLPGGDRDSAGLFQQRPGWASHTARTTPRIAATMFLTGGRAGQPGLIDIPDWKRLPLSVAAQAVQRSATPNAYAAWAGMSAALVGRFWPAARARAGPPQASPSDGASAPDTAPGPVSSATPDQGTNCAGSDSDADGAGDPGADTTRVPAGLVITGSAGGQSAVRFALAQLGKPYRWGADGPDAYDCSGLTMSAWAQARHTLLHFTGDQVRAGTSVPGGLHGAVGGDLVFIPGSHGNITAPRHVGMVAGYTTRDGQRHLWIVHAPHTGAPVRIIEAGTWAQQIAAVRHIA